MEHVLSLPVVAKVALALGLILALNTARLPLLWAVVAGTGFLAFACGHGAPAAWAVTADRLFSLELALLLLAVLEVIWVSEQLRRTGTMDALVARLRQSLSRRLTLAVLPAVIGLLPMPGGALFSAPLVDSCDRGGTLGPSLKTRINYWFRHVMEYVWPFYPGVILALALTGLAYWRFLLVQLPVMVFASALGAFLLLRRVGPEDGPGGADRGPRRSLPSLLAPILVVAAVAALVPFAWDPLAARLGVLPPMPRLLPLALGAAAGILFQQVRSPLPASTWREILLAPAAWKLAALVAAVRVYGAFIEARLPGGLLVAEAMRQEFAAWGMPVVPVIMLLSFLAGLSCGLAIGFVGASFPVVLHLVGADPSPAALAATTMLAFACGHAGMLLSPVHVCLVVTNQHFGTGTPRTLAELLLPCGLVMAAALAYYHAILWVAGRIG